MNISVELKLSLTLSHADEVQMIGTPHPEHGMVISYGNAVSFRSIKIVPEREFKKVMGYRSFTTLKISWDNEGTQRQNARSDFLEYLSERGVPRESIKHYGVLFDNALAVDEEGTVVS